MHRCRAWRQRTRHDHATLLHDIGFTLEGGEILALLGANGGQRAR